MILKAKRTSRQSSRKVILDRKVTKGLKINLPDLKILKLTLRKFCKFKKFFKKSKKMPSFRSFVRSFAAAAEESINVGKYMASPLRTYAKYVTRYEKNLDLTSVNHIMS